jgi:hypothetical protein
MKLDIAIHSSDSNPFYLDFWPLVSRLWKEVFHVEPLLVYIDENHDIPIDTRYGTVIKMKPVPNVPVYLQCLWVRYWIPSQFPTKVCIISDIDMLPVSKTYFIRQIQSIPTDKYVHLNPLHENIPSCYHIALGSLYTKVLQLEASWEESVTKLYNRKLGHDCFDGSNEILRGKVEWGADEAYASTLIRSYPDQSIFVFIPRRHMRIDRTNWVYNTLSMFRDVYADAHCVRPYSNPENKRLVDKLIREIVNNS